MLTPNQIQHLKNCTVAIGLTDAGEFEPKEIWGTGFFINSNGYVLLPEHVAVQCVNSFEGYKAKEVKTEIVAFHLNPKVSVFDFTVVPISNIVHINLSEKGIGYTGPEDLDLAVAVPVDRKRNDYPFMQIKHSSFKPLIASEVAMSGYPKGLHTMNFTNRKAGIRVSPVIQYGRISGFMLYDDAPLPYGIQTDIVGTGGSSGSPIVETTDSQVIGIAQEVVPTEVMAKQVISEQQSESTKKSTFFGMAKIGLVYGVTNQILYSTAEKARMAVEQGITVKLDFTITDIDKIMERKRTLESAK